MRFQRGVCIYNPTSGGGADEAILRRVGDALRASVKKVRMVGTEAPNHASEIAREASAGGADLIAVLAGDGTVNEVLQGVAGSDAASLLVLPGGTANVLIREIGMPREPIGSARMLPALKARTVSLGLVEFATGDIRYFLLMCGAGLDAGIVARTPVRLKHRLGMGAFLVAGAGQVLRRFPRLGVGYTPRPDSGSASSQVMISKSRRYGGGMVFTPHANLLSSKFEVAQFAGTSRLPYIGYLLAGMCAKTAQWPGIRHSAGSELTLVPRGSKPVWLQVDGEVAGTLPAKVSVSSKSLRLLLPETYATTRQEVGWGKESRLQEDLVPRPAEHHAGN